MAPKPKVADLEAKLKSKEEELQGVQSALTKAEGSRAKLKQYLEAFREQAVNTTRVITQFQQLQQDHNSLQQRHTELERENEKLRREAAVGAGAGTAATTTTTAAPASATDHVAVGASSTELSEFQRLLEEERRGRQRLQERCAALEEEQRAATREAQRLRKEREDLLQEREQQRQREREQQRGQPPAPPGTATGSGGGGEGHQDLQSGAEVQSLLSQLQQLQRANQELRAQLDSSVAVRHQELGNLERLGGSTGVAVPAAEAAAPCTQAAVAKRTRGRAAAAAAAAGATAAEAVTGRSRRRAGAPQAPESVAGSAVADSDSDSDSDDDSDGLARNASGDGGGSAGGGVSLAEAVSRGSQRRYQQREQEERKQREQREREQRERDQREREERERRHREREQRLEAEAAAAREQGRAAEEALEGARRELGELRRREAAQRSAMEEMRAQLQALQALVAEHAAALKRQGGLLERHDANLLRHDAELGRQASQLEDAGAAARRQAAEVGALREAREGDAAAVQALAARVETTESRTEALAGRVGGMAAQLRGVTRTHSILRQAFGGGGGHGGGGGWDSEYGDDGAVEDTREPWGLHLPAARPRYPLPPPPAAPALVAPGPRRQGPGVQARRAAALEEEVEKREEVDRGDMDWQGVAAGWRGAEDVAEGEEEEEEDAGHRDKRRRLEGPGAVGHKDPRRDPRVSMTDAGRLSHHNHHHQYQLDQPPRPVAAAPPPPPAPPAPSLRAIQTPVADSLPVAEPAAGCRLQQQQQQQPFEAGVGDAAAGQRRSRGRPRKERSPSELLATLLDGKANSPGQLAKVAAAAAKRAAAAVRGGALHPAPLAAAVCNAVLRCCRARVGVPAAADGVGGTAGGGGTAAAAAVDVLLPLEGGAEARAVVQRGSQRSGGVKRAVAAPSAAAAGTGEVGFLAVLLPPHARSRSQGSAAAVAAAGMTLLDGLACLWCKPLEQQRQVVRWLLQVVQDTDRLLGDTARAAGGRGGGTAAAAVAEAVAGPGSPVTAARGASKRSGSAAAAAAGGGGGVKGAKAGQLPDLTSAEAAGEGQEQQQQEDEFIDGEQEDEEEEQRREVDDGAAGTAGALERDPSGPAASCQQVTLLGGLLVRQLSAVVSYPWGGGDAAHDAPGTGGSGPPGGSSDRGAAPDGVTEAGPAAAGAAAAAAAAGLPSSLAERCAAAHALGQLFRLYRDREGFQSTSLELLHAAAEARCCSSSGCSYSYSLQPPSSPGRQPDPPLQPLAGGASLVPLTCLLAGWTPGLLPQAPPPRLCALHSSSAAAAGTTAAEPGIAPVEGEGAGVKDGDLVKLPLGVDGEDLFGESDSEPDLEEADQQGRGRGAGMGGFWGDPAREASLVSEPLAVAMTVSAQLLALERLNACFRGGSGGGGGGGGGGVMAGTHGSVSGSIPVHPLALDLDSQAEAVAAAALLRALSEEQQQQAALGSAGQAGVRAAATHGSSSGVAPPAHGVVVPGVVEVLIAAGVMKAPSSDAANAAPAATAPPRARTAGAKAADRSALAETVVVQSEAAAAGDAAAETDRGGGGAGAGGGSAGGGGDGNSREEEQKEDLDGALAAALAHARSVLSELAARLLGLLQEVLLSGRRRHGGSVGLGATSTRPGEQAAPPERLPSLQQSHLQPPPPSADSEAIYIASLRQALLLTCQLLPYHQVYDRVLRELASWLADPAGPLSLVRVGDTMWGRRGRPQPMMQPPQVRQYQPSCPANVELAVAGETAASAAGSPLGAGVDVAWAPAPEVSEPGEEHPPAAAAVQPRGVRDGVMATAAAAVAASPNGPWAPAAGMRPVTTTATATAGQDVDSLTMRLPDPAAVRPLLELLQDIACQALGSSSTAADASVLEAGLGAGPRPVVASAGAADASLALRIACASLCESLAGLLPALLPAGAAGRQGDGEAAAALPLAGEVGRDLNRQDYEQDTTAAAAALVSTVVNVAGMCMAGFPAEDRDAVAAAAAAPGARGGAGHRQAGPAACLGIRVRGALEVLRGALQQAGQPGQGQGTGQGPHNGAGQGMEANADAAALPLQLPAGVLALLAGLGHGHGCSREGLGEQPGQGEVRDADFAARVCLERGVIGEGGQVQLRAAGETGP